MEPLNAPHPNSTTGFSTLAHTYILAKSPRQPELYIVVEIYVSLFIIKSSAAFQSPPLLQLTASLFLVQQPGDLCLHE